MTRALGTSPLWSIQGEEDSRIPEATRILWPTLVALLLGALVGLERQVAEAEREKDFPGVRTFAFMALLGALAVLLSAELGQWMAVALFLAAVTFLVLRYRHQVVQRKGVGYTTELASMCTFAVGALAQAEQLLVATVVTIAMVVLLRMKRAVKRAGELLSSADMEILLRFLVITLIVFPLLPSEPLPVFDGVLRPRDVWRMVVLISGISFVGYALMRFRAGAASYALTGILAGLVSSTAAAFAYGRASRSGNETAHYEALIVLAGATAYLRILIMLTVVFPLLVPRVALPLLLMSATGMLLVYVRHRPRSEGLPTPEVDNPLTLRVALTFAAVYAAVLVLVNYAHQFLDDRAVYALSALAAIPGSDAPSLSLARLASDGRLVMHTAALGVVVVAVATTLTKLAIVAVVARGPIVYRVGSSLIGIAVVGALGLYWMARV